MKAPEVERWLNSRISFYKKFRSSRRRTERRCRSACTDRRSLGGAKEKKRNQLGGTNHNFGTKKDCGWRGGDRERSPRRNKSQISGQREEETEMTEVGTGREEAEEARKLHENGCMVGLIPLANLVRSSTQLYANIGHVEWLEKATSSTTAADRGAAHSGRELGFSEPKSRESQHQDFYTPVRRF